VNHSYSEARYGVLKDKKVILTDDIEEWARAFEVRNRRVAFTVVKGAHVSTMFLGVNHSFEEGKELWFETMIFGGPSSQYCERYSTWEQALAGHERIVEALIKGGGEL
jgi:hypothetical protein